MKKIIISLIVLGMFFSLLPINITSADSNPLINGVVGYWGLDSTSGSCAIDSSFNHNDGCLINMEDSNWVAGKIDNCLSFDAVNEYVDLGNIASFERFENFSIECFAKWTSINSMALVSKMTSAVNERGWLIFTNLGYVYTLLRTTVGKYIMVKTDSTYNDDTWKHIVVTYDGSSLATGVIIYIDSILQNISIISDDLDNSIISTATCQIGGRDGVDFFDGLIDEVVIYTNVLSQSEIDFRYNNGEGRCYFVNSLPDKPLCISPVNKKLNINIDTTLKTKVIDIDNDTMNVSFYLNNVFVEKIENAMNNTIVESSNLSLDYSTMYHWYVVVEDEYNPVQSDTFIFATISEPEPVIPNVPPEKPLLISPNNNSINISINTRLKSYVNDIDNDFLSVRFYWKNNSEIQSLFSIVDYIIQTSMLNLEHNTTYSWYVVATDFIDFNISDIFTFTTEIEVEDEDDDIIPPVSQIDYSILAIGIYLAIIVFILIVFPTRHKNKNKNKNKRGILLITIELGLIMLIIFIMIFLQFG